MCVFIDMCLYVNRGGSRSSGQSFEGGLEAERGPGNNHHLHLLLLLQVNQQHLRSNACTEPQVTVANAVSMGHSSIYFIVL